MGLIVLFRSSERCRLVPNYLGPWFRRHTTNSKRTELD